MAAPYSENPYIILGHGIEDVVNFEERPTLPEGFTLVTIAECGIITTSDQVCPIMEAFSEEKNRTIFSNPKRFRKEIQKFINDKEIHIYKAGSKYPNLSLQMFLDWSYDKHVNIAKSGVFLFPINSTSFQIGTEGSTFCEKIFKKIGSYEGFPEKIPKDYNIEDQYSDSLIPTVEDVDLILKHTKRNIQKFKEEITIPLNKIFEKCGPGIYYYVICRSPKNILSPKNLINADIFLNDSVIKNINPYISENWAKNVNKIIPILEKSKMENKIIAWGKNSLNETIKKYKNLQKVPQIRKLSIEQQEANEMKGGKKNYYRRHYTRRNKKRRV